MVRTCRIVPKEWTKYAPVGKVIRNTRFVVFKTPLNEGLLTKLPKSQRFTVSHLFRILAERNERLGLVVDLTDTSRYYDRKDVEGMCVEYEKLLCPGRGFVERDEFVDQFNAAIQRFIDNSADKDALIGVHCTRGVNRSGYLICRFLIDRLGWSSHEAIDAFEKARGYPIEKGSYIQALHKAARESRRREDERESDEESVERRHKKKKRRRNDDDNEFGGNAKQMGDMIKQFLGVLGQEASQLGAESPPEYSSSPIVKWPTRGDSLSNSPAVNGVYEDEDDEGEDGSENGAIPDGIGQVDAQMNEGGTASKRRARRKRLQKMFDVMKRGRFHEIQQIQQEKYGA